MYAFIINYNRLHLPRRMADYLAECPGVTPIIIDNKSTYPPLLEYYETTPHKVLRMDRNYGTPVVWVSGILDDLDLHGGFVVTDPDLNIDHVPKDWPHVLQLGLDRHKFACKSGFSLRITDLPPTLIGIQAKKLEGIAWSRKVDDRFYGCDIDTTFCLCRSRLHDFPAVRSAPPYDAIHVPWYYDKVSDLPDDELYYMKSVRPGMSNYWTTKLAEHMEVQQK